MGRRNSGFGLKLTVFALLALVVYGFWQISVLRKEISTLKVEVASLKSNAGTNQGVAEESSSVAGINEHVSKARKYILDGKVNRARIELEKSLQIIKKIRKTGAQSEETLKKAQRMLNDTRAATERLLRKIEKEPEKKTGG